jgi:peptidoglycan hydrolase FlgJ
MQLGSATPLAADARGIDALRSAAARDPKAAIREAARQFEALFMQELLKSMRQATPDSGLLDNGATRMGTEMLDTQFATQMAGLRGGLGEVIARHLERQLGSADAAVAPPGQPVPGDAAQDAPPGGAARASDDLSSVQAQFVQQHAQAARAAQAQSGIPASFMVAQAAHESAWGQREIRHADGASAHNLFGIKAGAGWTGPVAEVTTTEVIGGEARKVRAKFRAYASYAEAFDDYAKLITGNARYRQVLEQTGSAQGFARELQRAGYATDPQYAEKLTRTINATLRLQRAVT